jgi:hypothetical protein
MATKPLEVQLDKVSHYVELEPYAPHKVAKEQLWLTMFSEWRGERVRIEATLIRHSYREGMGAWQLCSFAPKTYAEASDWRSAGWYGDMTDTARSRLYAAAKPLAETYEPSEDYARTYAAAIVYAIREQHRERYEPARTIRGMVNAWREVIGSEASAKLEELASHLEAVATTAADLYAEGANATTYGVDA